MREERRKMREERGRVEKSKKSEGELEQKLNSKYVKGRERKIISTEKI